MWSVTAATKEEKAGQLTHFEHTPPAGAAVVCSFGLGCGALPTPLTRPLVVRFVILCSEQRLHEAHVFSLVVILGRLSRLRGRHWSGVACENEDEGGEGQEGKGIRD